MMLQKYRIFDDTKKMGKDLELTYYVIFFHQVNK